MTPTTEAGKRLLDDYFDLQRDSGPQVYAAIAAIEAEAFQRGFAAQEHRVKNIRAATLARVRERVEGLLDSPAAYPTAMGPTIRAENDVVRAVLAILDKD